MTTNKNSQEIAPLKKELWRGVFMTCGVKTPEPNRQGNPAQEYEKPNHCMDNREPCHHSHCSKVTFQIMKFKQFIAGRL